MDRIEVRSWVAANPGPHGNRGSFFDAQLSQPLFSFVVGEIAEYEAR
ncbi:hypothetical protein ACX9NE_11920 [Mycobacterium sp. ML4]